MMTRRPLINMGAKSELTLHSGLLRWQTQYHVGRVVGDRSALGRAEDFVSGPCHVNYRRPRLTRLQHQLVPEELPLCLGWLPYRHGCLTYRRKTRGSHHALYLSARNRGAPASNRDASFCQAHRNTHALPSLSAPGTAIFWSRYVFTFVCSQSSVSTGSSVALSSLHSNART